MDNDTLLLLAARASRIENQDAIDASIVGMLGDPKEVYNSVSFPVNTCGSCHPTLDINFLESLKGKFILLSCDLCRQEQKSPRCISYPSTLWKSALQSLTMTTTVTGTEAVRELLSRYVTYVLSETSHYIASYTSYLFARLSNSAT